MKRFGTVTTIICVLALICILISSYMNKSQSILLALLLDNNSNSIRSVTNSNYGSTTDNNNLAELLQQHNPLGIPQGKAINLPSLRNADANVDKVRKIYGGAGDGKHLGGFTELDLAGVSPAVWKYMVSTIGVHSILDVACGRGISTSWFYLHNIQTQCVEGSHDAIEKSIFGSIIDDKELLTEHDFSRGPWWPEHTVDAVWAVEVLEHIGVNYHYNYISAFRKAAILFVTSSRWGGWHHVEVHADDWWIRKYELYGFKYDDALTQTIRNVALQESKIRNVTAPNNEYYNAQHVWLTMKVFINPIVAALPQHAHLFPEHGCFSGDRNNPHRICGQGRGGELESTLPKEYWPIELNTKQDDDWFNLIRKHVTIVDK